VLRSGKTVVQHIYDSHFDGAAVAEELLSRWRSLAGRIDATRFVAARNGSSARSATPGNGET
jgi:alpha-glucuronidase